MTTLELSSKTVIELRKIARANGVKLSAGISKEGIVARLTEALDGKEIIEEAPPAAPAAAPAEEPAPAAPAEPAPAVETKPAPTPAQPQYKAAWQNPASQPTTPRYNAKPAYQAPAYPGNRVVQPAVQFCLSDPL